MKTQTGQLRLHLLFQASMLAAALCSSPAWLFAQQQQSATGLTDATPGAVGPATPPVTPSPATLKLARQAGLRTQVRNGVTLFCWEDANIGTRFKTTKCVNESRLAEVLEQRQTLRDQLQKSGGCGGAVCGGAK